MDPTSAIVMLSCIYWGALFGGAITSILFKHSGEAWSVATPSTATQWRSRQGGRGADRGLYLLVHRARWRAVR